MIKKYENFGYVLATKKILEKHQLIKYAYRETPDNENDSGWRFFSGNEDETYLADPDNIVVCDIASVLEIDALITNLLFQPYGIYFERDDSNLYFHPSIDDDLFQYSDNLNEISSIRYHVRRCISEYLYDRSFVCNNKIVYVSMIYGTRGKEYIVREIEKQPQANEFCDRKNFYLSHQSNVYDVKTYTCNNSHDSIRYCFNSNSGFDKYVYDERKDIGDSIHARCFLDAQFIDLVSDKPQTFDLTDLANGIIHTDKGDITKDCCKIGKCATFERYSPYTTTICNRQWNLCMSEFSWFGNSKGKYVEISPILTDDERQNGNYSAQEARKERISRELLSSLIPEFEFDSDDNQIASKTFPWGKIYIERLNDPHLKIGGDITIKFNGDPENWKQ